MVVELVVDISAKNCFSQDFRRSGKKIFRKTDLMATKCDRRRYSTRRELSSVAEDVSTGYNLRKKVRIKEKDDFSLGSESTVVQVSRRV